MEIKNLLTGVDQYKAKMDKARQADKAKRGDASGAEAATGDTISLSNEAKLRTEAHRAATNAPDVRQEKVDALKAQVDSGAYTVDSRQVAEKLVKEELDLFI